MKNSPATGIDISNQTKKYSPLQINFENPDFRKLLNKTPYKDIPKIIDFDRLDEEQKNLFIEFLGKRVLIDISLDLKKLIGLKKILIKFKIQDLFLKDFIEGINFVLKNIPNIVIMSLNGKNEADTKWSIERPWESSFLNELFLGNGVLKEDGEDTIFPFAPTKTNEIWEIIKYLKSINFILIKSNKKSFQNFIELLDLIKIFNYKNTNT